MPFHRIAVIGNPGSGKSTLSEAWGRVAGLPVVHLDLLAWKPNWVLSTEEELEPLHAELLARDRWIIEGYTHHQQLRRTLAAAEQIVFLDTPLEICLERAEKRMAEQKEAPNRFTQENCLYEDIREKHLQFIVHFHETLRPFLLGLLRGELSATPQVVLDGRLSVRELCSTLKSRT